MSKNVYVKSYTWKRDSHGLFDYESKCLSISNINLAKNLWLSKRQDEKLATSQTYSNESNTNQHLGKLIQEGQQCRLYPADYLCRLDDYEASKYLSSDDMRGLKTTRESEENSEQLYYIVRSYPQGWSVTSGDLLKMGRIKFFIREVGIDGVKKKADSNKLFYKNDFNCEMFKPTSEDDCMTCRTCLDDTYTEKDPLLTLCRCTGSIKYMHLNCLKQWLHSKLHIKKSDHSLTYNYKNFSCELCTMPYPKSLKYKGSTGKEEYIDLLEYEDAELGQNYIVLETLNKENNLTGALHILVFDQGGEVTIGRGSESNVRISDISVSRTHSIINQREGKFYVRDNKSKFGTLVRANAPLIFNNPEDKHYLQFGRTIFGLALSKYIGFTDILNNSKLLLEKEQQKMNSHAHTGNITLDQTQNIQMQLGSTDFMHPGGMEMDYNLLYFNQHQQYYNQGYSGNGTSMNMNINMNISMNNESQHPNTQDKQEQQE